MLPERWKQIDELFQLAVELPSDQRGPFLSEKCRGDDDLRLQVEALLKSEENAGGFIESPVWTDSRFLNTSAKKDISASIESDGAGDRDNYLGRTIGAFRIVKEIGRGGMGAVYLAERTDGEFSQRVAIKLIKRGMDSDFIVKRFRHERQILASLEHPFIARLLDGGTTIEGVPYFIMEFIQGETIYRFCDSRRMDIKGRLKLFRKVCSAIEYAHEKQIVHRDIKPGNILIDKHGNPKLLDFGIAKILDPDLIHESFNPTASMLRMMTPDYASPEQVQGVEVTPASDIYSLGVLLYELLTGYRPFSLAGRAFHEVSELVCEVMPEPPSRSLGKSENLLSFYGMSAEVAMNVRSTSEPQLARALRAQLDSIVMKALAKRPQDRYPSVREFSEDVSRYLSGSPVVAPKYRRGIHSRPASLIRIPEDCISLAVLPFRFINLGPTDDTDDSFLSIGLADALITRLSKVRRLVVRPTSSIASIRHTTYDPIRAGQDLKVEYILDGNIKKANDRLRVTVQLLNVDQNAAIWATAIDETMADVLSLEDTLTDKVVSALLPQLTGSERESSAKRGTDSPEAFAHYLRGRYHFNSFTEDGLAQAFVCFHQAIAADPDYALAYAGIADYYNWLGIIGVLPPQECFQPAITAAARAVELDERLSEAHASLGFSLHAGNYDWRGGEEHLLKALQLNPTNANAYVWFSIVLYTQGRFEEGLEYAHRSVDLDPLTAFNHHNIGWGLYFARRYNEAAEQYRRVTAEFPNYGFGYYGLSKIHRIDGQPRLALAESERAHELMGGSIFSMISIAECYAAEGRRDKALELLAELDSLSANRYVSPYQIALVHSYLGDKGRTLDYLEKALETKEAWLNWMGIEPAFDLVRGDSRFESILDSIGYLVHFKDDTPLADLEIPHRARRRHRIHDRTTLVIEEGGRIADDIRRDFRRRQLLSWPSAAAVVVSLIILVSIYFLFGRGTGIQPPGGASFKTPSIVILPFESSDVQDRSLGVGLADALTAKLGNIKSIQVMSANAGRQAAASLAEGGSLDLEVDFVLKGSLSRSGEVPSLDVRLENRSEGAIVWSEQFRAEDGDLFSLQTRLAERIWTSLGIQPLPLERHQVEKSYTRNPEAYERYLIARELMSRRTPADLRAAIAGFGESLRNDADFALAYVGLADSYSLLKLYDVDAPSDAYDQARKFASNALVLDDGLAEAHASMAYVLFFADRDRAAAELEFRRAIQINPSLVQAHHWFALFLAATGKHVEAIQEIREAKRLDPRSLSVMAAWATIEFYGSNLDDAVAAADQALAVDPSFVPALKVKRWALAADGRLDAAAEVFLLELKHSGGSEDEAGWKIISAQVGRLAKNRAEAEKELDAAAESGDLRGNPGAFAFEIALAYNSLGDLEKTFAFLQRAETAGSHGFNYLEVDPRLKDLQKDPRFLRLSGKLRRQN